MKMLRIIVPVLLLIVWCGAGKAQEGKLPKAFPFKLKDTLGRIVCLEDFKGKALVLDFWFTGCSGCVQVAEMLHKSVIPVFKSDTNVVFLSVNIDINFLQWKRSIAAGLYTSKDQVNLFTMGMGGNHPLFKHYNFSGCPQMLIINTRAEVVSTSLPLNSRAFIDMIKQSKI